MSNLQEYTTLPKSLSALQSLLIMKTSLCHPYSHPQQSGLDGCLLSLHRRKKQGRLCMEFIDGLALSFITPSVIAPSSIAPSSTYTEICRNKIFVPSIAHCTEFVIPSLLHQDSDVHQVHHTEICWVVVHWENVRHEQSYKKNVVWVECPNLYLTSGKIDVLMLRMDARHGLLA